MEEIWKPVKGYDGRYSVSNTGKIKTHRYGWDRIMKPAYDNNGYKYVQIIKKKENT